jgi:hypothetical protein
MRKTVTFGTLIGVGFLMLSAPHAMAHDRSGVRWSVTVGSSYPPPIIYSPPQVIYSPPPVVYVPVQPVYGQPYPTYVQPHPTYIVPQPIYGRPGPVRHFGPGYHNGYPHPHYSGHERRHFRSHGQYYRSN